MQARRFAERCFTSLELYSLKDNFKSLADVQPNAGTYLKEDTLVRFLEVPDALQVSPVLFHMISFFGSFPFLDDAPVVLGLEEVVIVVTLLTERYRRVLSKGATDRRKLLFKSLAVYDRKLSEALGQEKDDRDEGQGAQGPAAAASHGQGFVIDEAGEEEPDDELEDEDDDLVLSAFQSLDYVDALKVGNPETIHGAMIPADNFRRLITLLLLIAPLGAQERLSQYPVEMENLRCTADSILAAFLNVEKSPGIKFRAFNRVIESLPLMFDGFNALFEHFLFSRNLDFGKSKRDHDTNAQATVAAAPVAPLLLETGSILTHTVLSQLSFFIPGSDLFRRLRLLYSGDKDGFSVVSHLNSMDCTQQKPCANTHNRAPLRAQSSTGAPPPSSSCAGHVSPLQTPAMAARSASPPPSLPSASPTARRRSSILPTASRTGCTCASRGDTRTRTASATPTACSSSSSPCTTSSARAR